MISSLIINDMYTFLGITLVPLASNIFNQTYRVGQEASNGCQIATFAVSGSWRTLSYRSRINRTSPVRWLLPSKSKEYLQTRQKHCRLGNWVLAMEVLPFRCFAKTIRFQGPPWRSTRLWESDDQTAHFIHYCRHLYPLSPSHFVDLLMMSEDEERTQSRRPRGEALMRPRVQSAYFCHLRRLALVLSR